MLRFAAVVLVGALSAVGAAGAVVKFDPSREASAANVQLATTPVSNRATPAQVTKGADGHYWATADVDGSAIRFLVDTGATAVALTATDAQRLGLDLSRLTYGVPVTTADGKTMAAQVKLRSVTIAGARVENVDALVLQSGLETSLLGMSYLGRLSSFEATRTALILKP
ncbi:MAG: TIGR02281 family clan AA aspartic protease [Caulobacteraceae bacterium]|nr:TIGR02281 family clan AA aspartic protease [Caulobacter sp.]RYF90110.1 MAG: TIGR02281 family clan AA aspartic protease [Caulobacteraceae bacterium]